MTFKTPKPVNFKSQGIPENTQKMKGSRPKSNDPCLNVKLFCNLCDGVYQMSGLRKHIAHRHKMTKSDYIAAFGDIKKQIISLVYHSCGICKQTMLLDTDIISKHTTKKHKMGYTAYAGNYMRKKSGLIKKEKMSVKKVSKKISSPPKSFGKEFWQNILSKKSGSSTSDSKLSSNKSLAAPKPVSKASPKLAPKTPAKKSKPARKSPVNQTPSPATRTHSTFKKSSPSTKPAPSSQVFPPTPPATPPIIKEERVVKKEKEDVVMTEVSAPTVAKNLIVIQCEICSKTFSKNIQLRAHTRKNHS